MPVLSGDNGDNLLTGSAGADTLNGLGGNDTLVGGPGADRIDGGAGVDWLSYATATSGVVVLMSIGSGGEGDDQFTGVENVEGSGFTDGIHGNSLDNEIRGGAGDDQLKGDAGADTLVGGRGVDALEGGDGADAFVFAAGDTSPGTPDVISDWSPEDRLLFTRGPGLFTAFVSGDSGRDRANQLISTGAKYVAAQTPSGVILYVDSANDGGSAEDAILLAGRTLDDISAANIGTATAVGPVVPPGPADPPAPSETADTLFGTAGADTLSGGPGDDVIYNTPGDDLLDGGLGNDTLDLSQAMGAVDYTFGMQPGSVLGLLGGRDTITDFERVVGTPWGDRFSSTSGNTTIVAGGGDDTISARAAGTVALGGDGDDRIYGYGVVSGENGNDTLEGGEATARLDGGPGADLLSGGGTLVGGAGDDTISGVSDQQTLIGGSGSDLFALARVGQTPAILDWENIDRLVFGDSFSKPAVTYAEMVAATPAAARTAALARIQSQEVNFVAVEVGGDVYVFADSNNTNELNSSVRLAGRTLNDISESNIVGAQEPPAAEPTAPPAPTRSYATEGTIRGDLETVSLISLLGGEISPGPEYISLSTPQMRLTLQGSGFTFQQDSTTVYAVTGGTVTNLSFSASGPDISANMTKISVPAATLFQSLLSGTNASTLATVFAGNDHLRGQGQLNLVLRGYGGDDRLAGGGGKSTIYGGMGDDIILANVSHAAPGFTETYLRGDEGADYIAGGEGFDDINGNMGNDTGAGGAGDDWVVGGKDSDLLFGDAGNDLVYGNLGNDTCYGGAGNDVVRGGQEDDQAFGGAGDDFISGDRGNDTLSGGAGADTFNTFAETGLDRVTDFSIAEGDRVQLAPGTQYTVAQVGADTVISMSGGGQMVLVGVQLGTLQPGWIFGA